MRKLILLAVVAAPLAAQGPQPRLINAADAKSQPIFGTVMAVRQLPNGALLVNDGAHRQLTMLDPSLAGATLVADSTSGTANSYGTRPGGLIAYAGDSTLFVDPAGLSMFVIDPTGKIARVASVPRSQDAGTIGTNTAGTPGLDAHGRLVYRGGIVRFSPQGSTKGGGMIMPDFPDTVSLVRIDMATRKIDTIAHFKIAKTKMNVLQTEKGITMMSEINPMQTLDDWAVLSNGSVAIVRGQDYHVDILGADGQMASGAKIPFDWQRLTDDDKVAIIDSAKAAMANNIAAPSGADANGAGAAAALGSAVGQRMTINFSTGGGSGGGPVTTGASAPTFNFVTPSELPDYRPAFSANATRADLDGNLWVRTSATRAGAIAGPIYDVIDGKGTLIDRVQVPSGRQVIGFGKSGVVYLLARDQSGAWLERTHR